MDIFTFLLAGNSSIAARDRGAGKADSGVIVADGEEIIDAEDMTEEDLLLLLVTVGSMIARTNMIGKTVEARSC